MSDLVLKLELIAEATAETCNIAKVDLLPLELFSRDLVRHGYQDLGDAIERGIKRMEASNEG